MPLATLRLTAALALVASSSVARLQFEVPLMRRYLPSHQTRAQGIAVGDADGDDDWVPAAAGALALASTLAAAWPRHGRTVCPATALLWAPVHIVWKLPSYAALPVGRGERRWIRTPRGEEASP